MVDIYGALAAIKQSTPQTQKASPEQVENNAGGYVFSISDLSRAKRFLILGSDAGTYYQKPLTLTRENASVIEAMANSEDDKIAEGLVNLIIDVSHQGLAPKVQPALFALAMAANGKNQAGRAAAKNAVAQVVRTGSHLLTYIRYVDLLGGWSRGKRAAINAWYDSHDADQLAYQFIKYLQRDGWSQRDILRVTHPKLTDPAKNALFDWVTKENVGLNLPELVHRYMQASMVKEEDDEYIMIRLIENSNLSWEMLPDWVLRKSIVWQALLANNRVPMTALIRNLSRLTELGVIDQFGGEYTQFICDRLTDEQALIKARIHPISILMAAKTYKQGQMRSGRAFNPSTDILDALDRAFYLAFKAVEPSGKRTLIGLDVSGSMDGNLDPQGILSAREAGTAMALVLTATEEHTATWGFSHTFVPLNISPRERLDSVINRIRQIPFGRTDCSLPMREALKNNWDVDTFVIITDNETYLGPMHPHQALEQYRRSSPDRRNAKMIILSVTATGFSIADPSDPLGQLDICGFGSDVPQLVSNFSKGI